MVYYVFNRSIWRPVSTILWRVFLGLGATAAAFSDLSSVPVALFMVMLIWFVIGQWCATPRYRLVAALQDAWYTWLAEKELAKLCETGESRD